MITLRTILAGRRQGMIIRHDDAAREHAYGRDSRIGRLCRALDEAAPLAGGLDARRLVAGLSMRSAAT